MAEEKISGVPPQKEGGHHDTKSEKCFETAAEAKKAYKKLKNRFLDVNNWQKYAGQMTSEFALYNTDGVQVYEDPEEGFYFRIKIPAPGNDSGDGYDWVRIRKINEENVEADERCLIEVHPSPKPLNEFVSDVAHFYSDKASSNFLITRKGNCITAEVHGRNETSNTAPENTAEKLRNMLISLGGRIGIAKIQWKLLVNGLLEIENE